MRMIFSILVGFGLTVSLQASGGQEPTSDSKPPVIRAPEAFTVVVDAVVTDQRNRVLSDLTADDFRIFENGVRQTIDSLRFIQPEPAEIAAEVEIAAEAVAAPPREPREFRPNLIIFLLDYATTEFSNQKLVRDAAQRYVEESLRLNDYVAVFSLAAGFRFLEDFTNDRARLLAALGASDAAGQALSAAAPAATPPGTGSGEVGPISVSGGSPAAIAASAQAAAAQGSQQAQLMLAERIQQLYYTMTSYLGKRETYAVLGALQAISQVVGEIPGRKTLMLFSQGFVVGPHMEPELDKTVSLANKANLAVYGIDSQGLTTRELSGELIPRSELAAISSNQGRGRIRATGGESLFDRARQVGSDLRDSALRYISTATGGFAIRNSNNLFQSLQRVDEDSRSYYLLTYRPDNLEFDGSFREIRVEVERKDVEVRSRSGYIAVPPGLETLSGDEFQLVRGVNRGDIELDLPLFLRLDRFWNSEQAEIVMTLELAGGDLQFTDNPEDKSRRISELSIVGLIRDVDGAAVHRFGGPVTLNASPEEQVALTGANVRFSNALSLDPGIYSVSAIVRDQLSERTGRVEQSLRIPPRPTGLSLSGIVLGKDVEAVSGADQRLQVGGALLLPSAQREFTGSDRLVYYFEIYPPTGASSDNYQVAIGVVPSGSSQEITLPIYQVSGDGLLASAKFLDLSGLSAGGYFLRVEVTSSDGAAAHGQTSFRLVP